MVVHSDRRTDYTRLVFKIDREVENLHQVQESAQEHITSAQTEIEQIDARKVARGEQRTYWRQVLANLDTEVKSARNLATRSQDLPLANKESKQKLRELEHLQKKQLATSEQAENEATLQENEDTARRTELEQTIQDAQAEIQKATQTLREAEDAKRQAFNTLGEEERREALSWLEASEERKNKLRAQLLDEELRQIDYLEGEAIPHLQDWPEHVAELRAALYKRRPYQDEVTQTLEGLKQMLESLLKDPRMIPGVLSVQTFPAIRWSGGDLSKVLTVPLDELYAFVRGNVQPLQQRLIIVSLVLDEYRQKRQMEG